MLRGGLLRRSSFGVTSWQSDGIAQRFYTQDRQIDEPLRILFCGSEGFSIAALEALDKYKNDAEGHILSIDVAARKDKPGGRGMKQIRSPPIKRAAHRLGLRVHEFDTFTGWNLPEYRKTSQPYINLVIAVSFGLLVPARILKSARFGGLNIHPSMLPEFRGAAPINWSIINGHTHTGVTVQTLHPSKFDHGAILDQTPEPGIAIPDPSGITAHELRSFLAPVGADMLVKAIRDKLYLQPYQEVGTRRSSSLAPKILPPMKAFDPFNDNLTMILRKARAIPKLWTEATCMTAGREGTKRVIFGNNIRATRMEDLPTGGAQDIVDGIPIGLPFALSGPTEDIGQSQGPIFIKVKGNSILTVPDLLVAGARDGPAAAAAAHAKLFAEPILHGSLAVHKFHQALPVPESHSQGADIPMASPESEVVS